MIWRKKLLCLGASLSAGAAGFAELGGAGGVAGEFMIVILGRKVKELRLATVFTKQKVSRLQPAAFNKGMGISRPTRRLNNDQRHHE
jgi:hypothetical protein